MQGFGNVNSFIREFKLSFVGCFKQNQHAALDSNDFYNVYSDFSQSLVPCTLNDISVLRVFARFRTGMFALKCHSLLYSSFSHHRDELSIV